MKKQILIVFMFGFISVNGFSQHFDPMYNVGSDNFRTWRDSGYYFMPELINFEVTRLFSGNDENAGLQIRFSSSDESGLTYFGKAILVLDKNKIPSDVTIGQKTRGSATILIPQDLLLCPSPSQELGLGQTDPYFPLFMSGSILSFDDKVLEELVQVTVQLNGFRVN